MALRFDDKGKYFTDYVTKESVPVVIQTTTHHIRGFVYVQEEGRLSDELNNVEQFLPVTQAVILDLTGNKLFETNFLAINRRHIVWIYPEETPPVEDTYAVEELLMGQEPLVTDETYVVEEAQLAEAADIDLPEGSQPNPEEHD